MTRTLTAHARIFAIATKLTRAEAEELVSGLIDKLDELDAASEDLEDGHDAEAENEHGGDVQDEIHDGDFDDEVSDNGLADMDAIAEQGFGGSYGAFG